MTITDLPGAAAWTPTGPECLYRSAMDVDTDPPPPDITATTLPDMSDEQEAPEGGEGSSAHKTRARAKTRARSSTTGACTV